MPKKSGKGAGDGGDDYEVGYKKPPKHSQFKKGQSGYKRGPRKQRVTLADVETAFDKALSAFITVNKALKGDHQATNLVLSMLARRAAIEPDATSSGSTADEFKAELEAIFTEMAAKAQGSGGSEAGGAASSAIPNGGPPPKEV
jgi:hypothetical protein